VPTSACDAVPDRDCPYKEWLLNPGAPEAPPGIVKHGRDKRDIQRYLCKLCDRTLRQPPATSGALSFREYVRLEAIFSVLYAPTASPRAKRETVNRVAERIGVDHKTVRRWIEQWRLGPVQAAPLTIKEYLHGRRARLTQDLTDVAHACSDLDQERWLRASVGDMVIFLRDLDVINKAEALKLLRYVRNPSRPMWQRTAKLEAQVALIKPLVKIRPHLHDMERISAGRERGPS